MPLLLLSIAPALLIIFYIYYSDKYDKEPRHLLVICFLLGAIGSILISTGTNAVVSEYYPELKLKVWWIQFCKAFFVVALVEEFSKYIFVRYFAQRHREFDEPYDGIMYAIMVSMGFAVTENLAYVFQGGIETAIYRAFTAVPAHATFGIIMGYYMGKAKFSRNRVKYNLLGLGLATIFHGTYDFFLFINYIPGISIGAFMSLAVGILLSQKAIRIHQQNSHFKPK
ncbi:RsiW-degrading membrane proteinase PrsW (M82 family) [Kordia periserrulae]|uniref:Protease PrsW n=1 Tax=Kordia periserrulae TaxID=701523 RepID=A0A2T6BX45_9FLAO|nr:PrsW family glutamic-type intramembrane protease [Kordia periserrulae]PTX60655.1 RsiW-degrading membrane proteinase PrsW (M82 family) [Kordia periserrulae]